MKLEIGLDGFLKDSHKFKKLRFAMLTHAAAIDYNYNCSILQILKSNIKIDTIFTPEHGFFGVYQYGQSVKEDNIFGIKTISLYGNTKEDLVPKDEDLEKIDGIIFDIVDIGARFYTYIWSCALVMKKAGKINKKIIVLDRPNPINGIDVEGPINEITSFVGLYKIPIRHGKTYGEILSMIAEVENIDIIVYPVKNWQREKYLDEIGFPFVMPSPNIPDIKTAIVYPGMCLLEGTNLSEGRGTTRPFEIFGAPFINPFEIEKDIQVEGSILRPIYFRPTFDKYKGELCGGFYIHVLDRKKFKPVESAVHILKTIKNYYKSEFKFRKPPYEFEENIMPIDLLWGSSSLRESL
ncbi:MAG: DUF1343 domain-containing protein [candidate division WOR-3 bacterium]|nr:DUF1343 domain-containing protein [candidate division WOR-3 bacterium]MDW8150410.1 DUF1343 domain-containing protein [candidate division WOR-3 bacterium]